jgi:UDP-N-acetylmuramate dehydrogenase
MTSNNNLLEIWLSENKIKFYKDFNIKYKSWLKAGGIVKNFITPNNETDCIKLIKFFYENKFAFYVLGNISNIIIRDGIINTPIINLHKLSDIFEKQTHEEFKLKVNAGTSMLKFSKYLINKGITGCEGLLGIPGTLGGGIVMNASSYGSCISDYLVSVEYIDENGKLFSLNKSEINFGFRKSLFQDKKCLILNINFLFPLKNLVGTKKTIKRSKKVIDHRSNFQENTLPNLGSMFATYDLYKDLKKKNFLFYITYFIYKILSFLVYKFSRRNFLAFRKFFVKIYSKLLKLDLSSNFFVSDKTINCLVNRGSSKGDDAIKFIKHMKKEVGNCSNLENIILDRIK